MVEKRTGFGSKRHMIAGETVVIAIIGAGIAGLSLGLALSQRGATVTVLEADRVASGASGVATSYLEPRLGNTAMRALEREAMRRWPHYAAQLEEENRHVHWLSSGRANQGFSARI